MAKNSHFVPIDLPDPPVEKQTADPSVANWPTPEQLLPVLNRISEELSRIQQGTSEFTPYGISFGDGMSGESGLFKALTAFKAAPTKENMDAFLAMAEQDVNLRCKREFTNWLRAVITPKEKSDG
jgi:hypothetical protein